MSNPPATCLVTHGHVQAGWQVVSYHGTKVLIGSRNAHRAYAMSADASIVHRHAGLLLHLPIGMRNRSQVPGPRSQVRSTDKMCNTAGDPGASNYTERSLCHVNSAAVPKIGGQPKKKYNTDVNERLSVDNCQLDYALRTTLYGTHSCFLLGRIVHTATCLIA